MYACVVYDLAKHPFASFRVAFFGRLQGVSRIVVGCGCSSFSHFKFTFCIVVFPSYQSQQIARGTRLAVILSKGLFWWELVKMSFSLRS